MELSRDTWRLSICKGNLCEEHEWDDDLRNNRKYVDFDILIVATSEIIGTKVSRRCHTCV
jgi:hypothetical protein